MPIDENFAHETRLKIRFQKVAEKNHLRTTVRCQIMQTEIILNVSFSRVALLNLTKLFRRVLGILEQTKKTQVSPPGGPPGGS